MKLSIGDQVQVVAGREKGKKGKVERVFPKISKVVIAGVNMYKKNRKPESGVKQGGIIDIVKPLPVANVVLICPKCNLPTRIAYSIKGKEKQRICKKCKQVID